MFQPFDYRCRSTVAFQIVKGLKYGFVPFDRNKTTFLNSFKFNHNNRCVFCVPNPRLVTTPVDNIDRAEVFIFYMDHEHAKVPTVGGL